MCTYRRPELIPLALIPHLPSQGRNKDYQALNIEFTIDVVKGALLINQFPDVLKPSDAVLSRTHNSYADGICLIFRIAGRLFTKVESQVRRQMRHLGPIIEERRRGLEEYGDDWEDKPVSS